MAQAEKGGLSTGVPRIFGRRGFTLLELLVVLAIVALLVALGGAAWQSVREQSGGVQCLQKMRQLGQAMRQYAQDHEGELPRSFHSAGAHRQPGWAASTAPYLGAPPNEDWSVWSRTFENYFRCPADSNRDPSLYSYGLNVYFELEPEGDSYPGSPSTWRRINTLPHPSRTILLAEVRPAAWADHFMCHLWGGRAAARNALASPRHRGKNNFLFLDGSARSMEEAAIFPVQAGSWNPWHPLGLR